MDEREPYTIVPKPPLEKPARKSQSEIYGFRPPQEDRTFNYATVELPDKYKKNVLDGLLKRASQLSPHPRIVDLGSGPGYAAEYLTELGAQVISIDVNKEAIAKAPLGVVASATLLPLAGGSVDAFHSKDMLSHILTPMRHRLFSEVYKALKPGGEFLLTAAETAYLEPFQYPVLEDATIAQAIREGFTLKSRRGLLLPPAKDWYWRSSRPRFVLSLIKE